MSQHRRAPEGNAIVYCEGAFRSTSGKTAHGLLRRSERYRVLSVVDSTCAGLDAGEVLDGKPISVPIVRDINTAIEVAAASGNTATHLVVGFAPDGGRLEHRMWEHLKRGITAGLHVDSGLHDFLSEDPEIQALAAEHGVRIRDIRKAPPWSQLHFFSGKIREVTSLKVAVLGTDSAVGKRTTAWVLIDALVAAGHRACFVGTGQTAWMQGSRHGIVLDSLVNDFVAGEIEHAVWSAWRELRPNVLVIEGQGSLLHPAYPGGFEILSAARPDVVVLQHAPARTDYDGFSGFTIQPLEVQIRAIELVSSRPVVAVTICHEGIDTEIIPGVCRRIIQETGLPATDVLTEGPLELLAVIEGELEERSNAMGDSGQHLSSSTEVEKGGGHGPGE